MKARSADAPGVVAEALVSLPGVIAALRAGAPPELAWEEWPGVSLAEDGTVEVAGAPRLSASVSAATRLARTTGAPLAAVLESVAAVVADDAEAHARRAAALAGPRASARILTWLPLAGAGLGALLEPGSVRLLLATALGWALLVLAAGLWWAGRRWTASLVERAVAAGTPR
ncbi:MAG: type II secretion protein F [Actinomycetes bacterium]